MVKRNKNLFPENFMFQLSEKEVENMISQNGILSKLN
ncbi:MAG: ORF6N domain-containing protein [Bacteroidetes bacterium]|nr:ORF6N domain-containing protein [Bacteroidota bacterium]